MESVVDGIRSAVYRIRGRFRRDAASPIPKGGACARGGRSRSELTSGHSISKTVEQQGSMRDSELLRQAESVDEANREVSEAKQRGNQPEVAK